MLGSAKVRLCAMSFLSKTFSSETVIRGLDIIDGQELSLDDDPDTEALEQELERLQVDRLLLGNLRLAKL